MPPDEVNEVTVTTGRKPRYFYGWNVVGASFLAHLASGWQLSTMWGFFFKPLQNEFGWSRSALAGVHSTVRVTEALIAPVVGPLIDKYGPRVLMPTGAIIIALAMLGATQINALWQLYLLRGIVVAIGLALIGALVTGVAVNNWFIRKRGRALAISRLGGNISNVIFVPTIVFVIATSDWRMMFVVFALVTWLFVTIPSAVLMRRRPEDIGLYPDGIKPGAIEVGSSRAGEQIPLPSEVSLPLEPVWNRREVLMTVTFWLLAICVAIGNMAWQGITISLVPYIQDLGYDDAALATVVTYRYIIQAVSVVFMGFLAEHAEKVPVRVAPFVIQGIGAFLFLLAGEPVFLWLAVTMLGLGFSGASIIEEVLWANYFGRLSLGLVRSLGFLVSFGFGASGPIAMNAVFDILGSYRPAFMVIIGLFTISAFIMGVVRPPKAHRYATAAEMTPSA
ncbi:L-lactate transporter [subsurface metagenome]